MASNTEKLFLKKLRNPKSFEYIYLKKLLNRELDNRELQEQISDTFSNINKYTGKLLENDVLARLHTYSGDLIIIETEVFVKPGKYFKITNDNFKDLLESDRDLSKSSLLKDIEKKLIETKDYQSNINKLKNIAIKLLAKFYNKAGKDAAIYKHLDRVLHFKVKLKVEHDAIGEFINKQHITANKILSTIDGPAKITLTDLNPDDELRQLISKKSNKDILLYDDENALFKDAIKKSDLNSDNFARFIVRNRNLPVSKKFINKFESELIGSNERADLASGGVKNWDNNRLMISLRDYAHKNPEFSKHCLNEDKSSLITFIKSLGKIASIMRFISGYYAIVLN